MKNYSHDIRQYGNNLDREYMAYVLYRKCCFLSQKINDAEYFNIFYNYV